MQTSTDPQTKTLGQAMATALTDVAASHEQSTKASRFLENEHKRLFLQTFKRWEVLFKRKDTGSAEDAKWLIAEYYKSLSHLTPEGFDKLTDILKETCVFFPTIRECLDAVTCKDRYDWGHPFRGNPPALVYRAPAPSRLPPPARQIGYDGE